MATQEILFREIGAYRARSTRPGGLDKGEGVAISGRGAIGKFAPDGL